MAANRGKDTTPELLLRRALWSAGFRGYRTHPKGVPGTPDILFPRCRLAIFVHGCFWHDCPKCGKQTVPKSNSEFWRRKFERTRQRDAAALSSLEASGYTVQVVWECEVKKSLAEVVGGIAGILATKLQEGGEKCG
jgi:DNA mismatch endonuclease (patch repair protein)